MVDDRAKLFQGKVSRFLPWKSLARLVRQNSYITHAFLAIPLGNVYYILGFPISSFTRSP